MRNLIITALVALIVGCGSGWSPELDSNTVINPGGGLGHVLYECEPASELVYSFSAEAWIGLPVDGRWQWHPGVSGSIELPYVTGFKFIVVAKGRETVIYYMGVR